MGKRWIPALVILVALFGWWMTRGPAIRPEEIDLDVVLRAPGMGENLQPGQADAWTLEIQLDKGTARPLGSHQVLPYVEGFSLFPWDFFQGLTLGHKGGSPVGEAGFHIGQDSRFRAPTGSALRAAGFSISPARLETARGFMYTGQQFPARVRFYLKGDGAPRPEQTVVVFTYRQIWLGRDLSWTKVVPARVETRAADEQAFTVLGLQPGQALSRTWFQGGQAMLWAPQPGKFSVGASLKQPDGSWTAASAPTTVTAADPLNFRQAVDLGPVTAIFGRTDHTSADAVLVTVAGAEPLRSEVRDGYWVVAHAGRLDPLDLIDLQYVSGRGTPIAGDLFSLAPRCRPSEPEPREGTTRIQLFFMCDEDLLMAPPR
ncbi:MAG TPA: hypothetical protein VNT75_04295, partial [Symbiobacteriaceae bacterium]|nr:hypothetical protein [Symbiobacteriaceae bacterium]